MNIVDLKGHWLWMYGLCPCIPLENIIHLYVSRGVRNNKMKICKDMMIWSPPWEGMFLGLKSAKQWSNVATPNGEWAGTPPLQRRSIERTNQPLGGREDGDTKHPSTRIEEQPTPCSCSSFEADWRLTTPINTQIIKKIKKKKKKKQPVYRFH